MMPKAGCLSGCWIDGSALEMALAEQVLNLEVVPEGLVGGSDHCRVRRRGLCEGYQEATVFMALKHSQQQRSHTGGGVPKCCTPQHSFPRCWTCWRYVNNRCTPETTLWDYSGGVFHLHQQQHIISLNLHNQSVLKGFSFSL